ncbi:HlyD family secretion protein [Hyunsoonleella pacifica]|uniref:HlyD family efflux transporter periplasmic adaptor subunit n=1 Tax=Hyunsoonleella pacifica TaxID=1080224 RepID=A0A4Q9FIM1_9FLAO|nr:HlyD family efflux transporter periplasmic adaptor subunit [Hyunsoonleella pacifica]TBN13123.1 HlyD family efflux transporter periplasmic adaptor subunit [Hyunsoonleella pacifica]GGD28337.1 hemolysin [Hyunsoonleella pacifica]
MADNSLKNIELRSEEVQDILTKVPNWVIRWGSTICFLLILLLLLIFWLVKYPDIIPSEALVTTQIPPQKEYARVTGKLTAVLVKDNATVNVNQPLAIIENTADYKDVFLLKSIIDTLIVDAKAFQFPLDNMPVLFLGDIDAPYALFENSYIQYKLNRELKPFSNDALANKYSIAELNRRLKNLQSQKEINAIEMEFKAKDLKRNETLFEKGIISEQTYENKQLEYAQAKRNYQSFESSISQIKENLSNAHKNSRGTEINRVKEEMTLLKQVIQSYNQLKKAIKDWEYQYVLRSDINGKVSFLNYWNVNQTVNQSDLVFTIIPAQSSLFIAKLKAPTQNSGKIKVGQTVNIKLENYPDTEFGVLKGIVKNISLIPNKEGFYIIDVELPKKLITTYNKDIDFKQEMSGSAEIITEDLRLIERLFYQFRNVLKR